MVYACVPMCVHAGMHIFGGQKGISCTLCGLQRLNALRHLCLGTRSLILSSFSSTSTVVTGVESRCGNPKMAPGTPAKSHD